MKLHLVLTLISMKLSILKNSIAQLQKNSKGLDIGRIVKKLIFFCIFLKYDFSKIFPEFLTNSMDIFRQLLFRNKCLKNFFFGMNLFFFINLVNFETKIILIKVNKNA